MSSFPFPEADNAMRLSDMCRYERFLALHDLKVVIDGECFAEKAVFIHRRHGVIYGCDDFETSENWVEGVLAAINLLNTFT